MARTNTVFSTRRPPMFLNKREAAAESRVSVRTIERWVQNGDLPAYRVGHGVRIKASDLDKLARRIPAGVRR